MTMGPGRYDDVCTKARELAKAKGTLLIVLDGEKGNGFSCQADLKTMSQVPDILENIARQIRADMSMTNGRPVH